MREQVSESSRQCAVLSPQGLPPGTRVGRWRVERRVGSGGNGTVYEVRRKPGGRGYALKLAHKPEDARFPREAEALDRVAHPGVVRLLEAGVWRAGPVGYPYLVQEYARGAPLYDWALARNPTSREVAGLLAQVADTLAEAHRQGVLHRDFKGDNTRVDEDQRLKVLDWGAGWHTDAVPLTSAARLPPGTPPYHSPQAILFSLRAQRERLSGPYRYTMADELYAVGVTFYRLLVEQYVPLRLNDDLEASVEEPGPWAVHTLNPRVPAPLAALVQRLLAFRPEDRPRSARDLEDSVRRALAEAGPEWDEPLFAWYEGPAPDTRTTQAAAPPGPIAPGHEVSLRLARTRRLDQARLHREVRHLRRRELAEVVTLPGARTGRRERWTRGPRTRRLVLGAGLLVVVTGVTWALAHWRPPPGPTSRSRQLAPPGGSADTAVPAAAPPSLLRPPWPEEAMSRTAPPCLSCLSPLHHYLLAVGAAATLTACPGPEVRPDPARCPPEALAAMRKLRMEPGDTLGIVADYRMPEGPEALNYAVPVRDGPISSLVEESRDSLLPEGTLLFGQLWTGGEVVIGRYTRARTPAGREYPVCLLLGDEEGWPKAPGSQPGFTLVRHNPFVTAVDRFP